MIKISVKDGKLILKVLDADSQKALFKPLHRLFFSSHFQAQSFSDEGIISINFVDSKESILLKTINHLERYNLEYELNTPAKQIITKIEANTNEYKNKLIKAKDVKKKLLVRVEKELRKLLNLEFKRNLTQKQIHAVSHLLEIKNGANFSVPGSGKTSIALAYFSILRRRGLVGAIFIVGPISSFQPWEYEFNECFGRPANSVRLAGKDRQRRQEIYLTSSRYEMLLTSYQSVIKDTQLIIKAISTKKTLLILDESHYIKRPLGGKIADSVLKIGRNAAFRVILSGTPMPNGFTDLWSQFSFLWPAELPLGKVDSYLREIREKKPEAMSNSVSHRLSPLFFRITKSELGLPKPNYFTIKCELSPIQSRIYIGVAAKYLAKINVEPDDKQVLREWRKARMIRMLQIASNPSLLRKNCLEFLLLPMRLDDLSIRSAIENYAKLEVPSKIVRCTELVKELTENRKKVVIWTNFIHNLKMLEIQLRYLNPVTIFGGIPYSSDKEELTREDLIHKFKTDPNCFVLLANPAACAESISLHKVCHDAIYLERTFNCAHYLQSLDRIHRLGLSKSEETNYYLLLARNSIDEVINGRLKIKMRNMRQLLEGNLPGSVTGYWGEDLGNEEEVDFELVKTHIQDIVSSNES